MHLQIDSSGDVKVVRLQEPRLEYPLLSSLFDQISELVELGTRRIVIDLSRVDYLDSAAYGCLMDIYRLIAARGGKVKIVGLCDRLERMARMVGITSYIDVYSKEDDAVSSFK